MVGRAIPSSRIVNSGGVLGGLLPCCLAAAWADMWDALCNGLLVHGPSGSQRTPGPKAIVLTPCPTCASLLAASKHTHTC